MVVGRCFEQYGVTNGAAWEQAILERSANWPQHLAAYLYGALTVLKAEAPSDEVMGDARRSSLAEAMAIGDEWRGAYYEPRVESLNAADEAYEDYARHLAARFDEDAADDSGRSKHEIGALLMAPPFRLDRVDANDFLKASRHAGLLERLPGGRMRMPIPSFAGHLIGKPLPPISGEGSEG